jgi:hypothetical protein
MVSRIGSSSNDNGSNDGDTFFFNDFSDTNDNFGGSSSSDRNMSSLLSRMSEVKGAEAAYDAKLARNWRRGNWSVRGFALDKSSGTEMNMEDRPIHVSVVAAPTLSDCIDSLLQDSLSPEDYAVAVGRTDGSVFIIQLGNQYLTNFVAVPKLIADQDAGKNNNTTGMVARVEKEWMSADQLKDRLNDDQQHMAGSDGKVSQNQSSFQIKYQFLASEQGEAINKLVFIDSFEDKDCDGIICAAPGSSGEISMTNLRYSSGDSTTEMQSSILSGVHHNEIISLQSMILHPNGNDADVQNILFSASRDGTFALWNLDGNGELITSCQCTDALAGGALTCADVFNPSSWDDDFRDNSQVGNDVIFLGTSNGYVVGFRVMDLLATAIVSSECPSPNLCFRAHGMDSGKGESVTAIKCGGDGTIVSSARLRATDESQDGSKGLNPRPSSFILLTGGEDGSVKQWRVIVLPCHGYLLHMTFSSNLLHVLVLPAPLKQGNLITENVIKYSNGTLATTFITADEAKSTYILPFT